MSGADDRKRQKTPTMVCGCFNSKPDSCVCRCVKNGVVDARLVSPWCHWPHASNNKDFDIKDIAFCKISNNVKQSIENNNQKETLSMNKISTHDDDDDNNHCSPLKLSQSSSSNKNNVHHDDCENKKDNANNNDKTTMSTPSKSSTTITTNVSKAFYIVDFSLNKHSRWSRMFGIDAELETDLEERERTHGVRM